MENKREEWIVSYLAEYVRELREQYERDSEVKGIHSAQNFGNLPACYLDAETDEGELFCIQVAIEKDQYYKNIRMCLPFELLATKTLKELGEMAEMTLEGAYLAIEQAVKEEGK